MKILLIIDSLTRGGRERRLVALLRALSLDPTLSITVVVLSDIILYPEVHDMNINILSIPRKPKKDPKVFAKIFHLTRKIKPSLIHTWGSMSTIYAIPASCWCRIPLVNGSIADAPVGLNLFDRRYLQMRLTFPFSHKIVGNSRAGLAAYAAPENKSICIPNGFDPIRLKNLRRVQNVREGLGIKTGQIVGMVGEFYNRKDYSTFLQAASRLLDKGYQVTFLGLGDGPNLQKCRSEIHPSHRQRILLPGRNSAIESVVNTFDIGVLCTNSDEHGEGISNSIMEYMAFAKPVVATAGGGTPEIVTDGKTGFLIPPKSAKHLYDKLKYLLDNPEIAQKMGDAGKNNIRENFSIKKMECSYRNLYASVAKTVKE